jgi:hypothetical protein
MSIELSLVRVLNKIRIEFQNIQNIKMFLILETILFLIGCTLLFYHENIPYFNLQILDKYIFNIFEIVIITVPVSTIFQAYKVYRKRNWIKLGNRNINVPLYLQHMEKKYKSKKEEYSVQEEINLLHEKFAEKEKEIIKQLEICKRYKDFEHKIIPMLRKQKDIKIHILLLTGKKYVEDYHWYLNSLLHLIDIVTPDSDQNIKEYIQKEIDTIVNKHHISEKELKFIKSGRDYSIYLIEMNQLVRNIKRYYATYLDNVDNHKENIEKLEKLLKDNPDIDNFVNNVVLKIERKKEEDWNKKIQDLEVDNYILMKYKDEIK